MMMRAYSLFLGVLALVLLMALSASAQAGTRLIDVWTGLVERSPQAAILEAELAARRMAALQAESPFDLRLKGEYYGRATGFYGGQYGGVSAEKRLDQGGVDVYGGYRVSAGTFPIYEDQLFTNAGGEFKVGVRVPILRGRETDAERTGRLNAALEVRGALADRALGQLSLKADAASLYLDWLYLERTLVIYRELLKYAEDRQQLISASVREGQLPAIAEEENRQILLGRQAQVIEAEQRQREALAMLSLVYRTADGNPKYATYGDLSDVPDADPYNGETLDAMLGGVEERRPDLVALRFKIEQERNKRALARNDRLPELSFDYEVSTDIGAGSITREGTDHILGLRFSVPLERSAARAQEGRAEANLKSMAAKLRLALEQVRAAMEANRFTLEATRAQKAAANQSVTVALTLREAEEQRFLEGASDVFRLNQVEANLASGRLAAASAQRAHDRALVDYMRITGLAWFE